MLRRLSVVGSLFSLLLFFSATRGLATTFYVSNSGNNSGSGSAASPWATLQYAAGLVQPGDTVIARAGTYQPFQLTTSGSQSARITFQAEAGARIVAEQSGPRDGINLEGASFVTIDGFEISGATRAGVRTVGPYNSGNQSFAQHVTIRNVTTHDNTMWGVLTGFVHDVVIENNRAFNSAVEHGIYVSNSGDRPIVRNNTVYGNRANGIHMNADLDSGLDGIITGAQIYGNVIYDNGLGGGSGINMDGVSDSIVENNLIYNAHASGISLYRIDGAEPSTGNIIRNNTIHQASNGRWAINIRDESTDNTIANNILISDHSFRGASSIWDDSLAGTVSDYNLVVSRFTDDDSASVVNLAQWQSEHGLDLHSIGIQAPTTANPNTYSQLFANLAARDYRLSANSLALNAGWNAEAAATDLLGLARPQGTRVDIGAYETPAVLPGDANNDGVVDVFDFDAISQNFGSQGSASGLLLGDSNDDGVVDVFDFDTVSQNFGNSGALGSGTIPEPPAIILTSISLALVCPRKARAPR